MTNKVHKTEISTEEQNVQMNEEAGLYDNISVSVANIVPHSFVFKLKQEEIIRIDEKGFYYKGEFIEDAKGVYKLFKEFLQTNKL